jgi:hypothetical protein
VLIGGRAMIYDVRLREILILEFQVESEDLKGAFLTAIKKAHSKGFKAPIVGRYFELEHLNIGKQNEFTPAKKSKPKPLRRVTKPKTGKS